MISETEHDIAYITDVLFVRQELTTDEQATVAVVAATAATAARC